MNQSTIHNSLQDLNNLVLQGKMMDAFEKYYDEHVVMQENSNEPTSGKEANRKREIEFLNNVVEFKSASVDGVGVADDLSFVIWRYDYIHKEWGVRKYTQVSVQRWKDGRIVKEQFFYGS